jgi:hypothetical protein
MQEVFLKLWERWIGSRGSRSSAYLFIALNGSKMRARAARRAAARVLPMTADRDAYEDVEVHDEVRRMLRSLAPRQRADLALLDLYGYDAGPNVGVYVIDLASGDADRIGSGSRPSWFDDDTLIIVDFER